MIALFKNNTANGIKSATILVGNYVVTAADVTATQAVINLSDAMRVVEGSTVEIRSAAGVPLAGGTITEGGNAGTLTIATGNGLTLTAGQVVRYVAWGSQAN